MKKCIVLFYLLFLLFPTRALAHGAGYPPFFLINGILPPPSLIQQLGMLPENIAVAQDSAPENYLVNQELSFAIDTDKLKVVYPPEIFDSIQYQWDFGDGTKRSGTANTHHYTDSGSYILQILATINKDTPPILIESVQLNILPKKNYKLPQAFLKINQKTVHDPLQDLFKIDFKKQVLFDASASKGGNGKLVTYLWDFGDGEKSAQPVITRSYSKPMAITTVYLRVIDSNNLVSDSFVTLSNHPEPSFSPQHKSTIFYVLGAITLCIIIFFIFFFGRKRGNPKS